MEVWMLILYAMTALAVGFADVDADGDGHLGVDELAEAAGGRDNATGLITMFDVDRDGRWSSAEFDAWRSSLERGPLSIPAEAFAQYPSIADILETSFAASDANRDGRLTAAELGIPGAAIAAQDRNRDGSLDRREFDATSYAGLDVNRKVTTGMVAIADQGRDARWSREELARAVRLLPEGLGDSPAAALARSDANGDGQLDATELDDWLLSRTHALMHAWADTSENGRLEAEEVAVFGPADGPVAVAAQLVTAMDRNKDGGLDVDEFGAWRRSILP